MAKPFEVTYRGPYGGLHVQAPENLIDSKFSPDMDNVILRNSMLQSRPRLVRGAGLPNYLQYGGTFFLSPNSVIHSVLFSQDGIYQLAPNAYLGNGNFIASPWVHVPVLPSQILNTSVYPMANQVFRNTLYYSNGDTSWGLTMWDGIATSPFPLAAYSGTSTKTYFASLFLGELSEHLLMASIFEQTGSNTALFYPQRIRWSNTAWNPTNAALGDQVGTQAATFDPSVNASAGYNDLLSVPDQITGLMTLGQVAYLMRQNGITQISVTGSGYAPFTFDNLWGSQQGIGNAYPWSIAQYGSIGIMVSREQIYQFSPSAFIEIGGGARDAIMADLANAAAIPQAAIVPNLTLGYTYFIYMLMIPMGNAVTRCYVYSIEDKNWMSWTFSAAWSCGRPFVLWV